ncbi:MAG TPA: tetratricopeptide repeat protein, partial [Armatimonadota bacterium]|nr:tetratricopeptide repeat protein [Armatimonadota bacterium]
LGVVYAKQGKYEQAAVNFARALEIQPDKATARTNLMKVRKIIEENKGPSIKTSRTTHENTHGPAS